MKVIINFLLVILLVYFQTISFCHAQTTIKTVESVASEKRRELLLNENLDVIKEEYFSNIDQKIIVSIEYSKPNVISVITGYSDYPTVAYKIDFNNGSYFDSMEGVELKFKDNFVFDGEQKGKNIIVNYIDNKKYGKLVQADSVAIGNKKVVYDQIDTRYLKYDIIKFYKALGEETIYKMYKGVVLNFKNNKLNGKQKAFYGDASSKFEGYFVDDKLIDYLSFSEKGLTISKLKTTNGVSLSPQILNGVVLNRDSSYVFWHPNLIYAGDIYFNSNLNPGYGSNYKSDVKFLYSTENIGGRDIRDYMGIEYYQRDKPYTLKFKQKFDSEKNTFSNPYVIKGLLNIPDFKIRKYHFSEEEDKSIMALSVGTNDIDTINTIKQLTINLADSFYYTFPKINFYEYARNYIHKDLLLIPKKFSEYIDFNSDSRMLDDLVNFNSTLANWLLNTFNIKNIFYLSPMTQVKGEEKYIQKYEYDSAAFNKFFNVFIEKMLSNINEIKNSDSLNVNTSILTNPFVGVNAGPYLSFKNFEYHFSNFDFRNFGEVVTLKNTDGIRYFKIYDKYRTDYFDGKCIYSFLFKQIDGIFKVEKIDMKCQ